MPNPKDTPDLDSLYYGDCLEVMERWPYQSVDLIYLDPPFNSKTDYNILFGRGNGVSAQVRGFSDTWKWNGQAAKRVLRLKKAGAHPASRAIRALETALGPSGMLSYVSYMGERLAVMRDLLKPTGSIFLHCDDTASAYLRVLMDSVFGPDMFRNEVIWRRTKGRSDAKRFGRVHDSILFYTRSDDFTWNPPLVPHTEESDRRYSTEDERGRWQAADLTASGPSRGESGKPWRGVDPGKRRRHWATPVKGGMNDWIRERDLIPGWPDAYPTVHARLDALAAAGLIHWPEKEGGMPRLKRYRDSSEGIVCDDVFVDLGRLEASEAEKLDYPTQKPTRLLRRLIESSSNEGDVVLRRVVDGIRGQLALGPRLRRVRRQRHIIHLGVDNGRDALALRLLEEHPQALRRGEAAVVEVVHADAGASGGAQVVHRRLLRRGLNPPDELLRGGRGDGLIDVAELVEQDQPVGGAAGAREHIGGTDILGRGLRHAASLPARIAHRMSFYSLPRLARRWGCATATAKRVCEQQGIELIPFGAGHARAHYRVRVVDVERLEQGHAPRDLLADLARSIRG